MTCELSRLSLFALPTYTLEVYNSCYDSIINSEQIVMLQALPQHQISRQKAMTTDLQLAEMRFLLLNFLSLFNHTVPITVP